MKQKQFYLAHPWPEILLWVLVILGSLIRFQTALLHNPIQELWSDSARHWSYAQASRSLSPLSAIDPFLYQLWLTGILKVTLGKPMAMGVYAGLLSVITPWAWYLFLKELIPNRIYPLLGWALLTWLPSWIGLFSYFLNETLLLPLLGLSLSLTWRGLKDQKFSTLLWASFCWGLSSLTRIVAFPLGGICLVYLLKDQPRKFLKLGLVLLMWFLLLFPVAYRAHSLLGVWAPFGYPMMNQIYMASGNREIAFSIRDGDRLLGSWHFISPSFSSRPFAPISAWVPSRSGTCTFTVDKRYGERDWRKAYERNKTSLNRWLRIWIENWTFLFLGPSWPDCNYSHFWEALSAESRWIFLPLFLMVCFENVRTMRRKKTLPLLLVLTLAGWFFCLFSPLAISEGRYRKPLEGLLIVNMLWLIYDQREQRKLLQANLREDEEYSMEC